MSAILAYKRYHAIQRNPTKQRKIANPFWFVLAAFVPCFRTELGQLTWRKLTDKFRSYWPKESSCRKSYSHWGHFYSGSPPLFFFFLAAIHSHGRSNLRTKLELVVRQLRLFRRFHSTSPTSVSQAA